ncbi:MAG: sugar transferase, partial [Candidatus Electryoneaceae bacterium]|nr:sugar transferase [Candidatus Electryoneaceae bacterium]
RKGPVMYKPEFVHLPSQSEPMLWRKFRQYRFSPRDNDITQLVNTVPESQADPNARRDFFLRFLPGLINIAKGELSFVGVAPRIQEEIESMPLDWKELYIQAKTGLITEAYIQYGTDPTPDEMYSAEAFYTVSAGFRHNCRLLLKYFGRVLTGKRK